MQKFYEMHLLDAAGTPSGGSSSARGIQVDWQHGPLGRGEDRVEPTGAFVETVIEIALGRLRFYQTASDGKFACRENALAVTHLEEGLHWLNHRTAAREAREVEGLNIP